MTGQLEEEKMQVYVRLGIRLLYKVRTAVHLPLQYLNISSVYSRALRVERKVLVARRSLLCLSSR